MLCTENNCAFASLQRQSQDGVQGFRRSLLAYYAQRMVLKCLE